ncbi:MAG: type II toxin-antitoxin system VapB family antitoxin [Thiotrichaceae bacterium]
MYIQTTIDDQLFQQAVNLTGLADKQALLEESLRVLIQVKKQLMVSETITETRRQKEREIDLPEQVQIVSESHNSCFTNQVRLQFWH